MPAKQSKYWCFASYEKYAPAFVAEEMQSLMYQEEACPTTGRHHWQSFVKFRNKTTEFHCNELFGKDIPMKRCKAGYDDNYNYCTKSKSAIGKPVFFGECPKPSGPQMPGEPMTYLFCHLNPFNQKVVERYSWVEYERRYGFPAAITAVVQRSDQIGFDTWPTYPDPPEGNAYGGSAIATATFDVGRPVEPYLHNGEESSQYKD